MKKTKNKTIATIALALILTISALMVIAPTNTVDAQDDYGDLLQYEWSQPRSKAEATGFSAGPAPNSPDVLWKIEDFGNVQYYPAAFNGKFFAASGNNLIAVAAFTGEQVWKTSPDVEAGLFGRSGVMGAFKVEQNTLISVQTFRGTDEEARSSRLMAIQIDTGEVLWYGPRFYNRGSLRNRDFLYSPDEEMFYATSTGPQGTGFQGTYIKGFSLADLSQPCIEVWEYEADGDSARVNYGDSKIFVSSYAPHQVCLDAATGEVLWDVEVTGLPRYPGTFTDHTFLRGHLDNVFHAFNAETGEVKWTFDPGTYGYWSSGSCTAYGKVYQVNFDGYLYALDVQTGALIWKYKGPGQYYPGTPMVADGKVYAQTGQSRAIDPFTGMPGAPEFGCFDAETGELLWKIDKEFGNAEDFCIAFGNLYGESDGDLYCFGPAQDWPMFRGDEEHTGIGGYVPKDPTLKWKFATKGAIISSPVVVDGEVYVGSCDKNWYKVDAYTGEEIWRFETGFRIRSSAAVVNGRVYTGADDGFFYCLDADTGTQLWKVAAPGTVVHTVFGVVAEFRGSPTVVDGKVYAGSLDGNVYCLNALNGNKLWTYPTPGMVVSSATIIEGDGLYIASTNGWVLKLNPDTGAVIWTLQAHDSADNELFGTPVVADGKVFIGAGTAIYLDAALYCINATSGEMIWTYENSGAGSLSTSWSGIYLDGKFYYADFFSFNCHNATNGEIIWETFLTREHYGSPVYADGVFYVPSDSFAIYVLDAETGLKTDYFPVDAQLHSSPAIWEGKIYFGSHDWTLRCLEETSTDTTYYGTPTSTASATEQAESTPAISAQLPETAPSPTIESTTLTPINMYLIAAAVAVVAVIVAAAIFLRKRK